MTLRHLAATAVLAASGSVANAQQVWISATAARSSHDLLPDPIGPAAGVTWALTDRTGVRVGLYHLADRGSRVGSTCVGLVRDPAECVEEPIDDRSALSGVALGLVTSVVRRRGISLAIAPAVSLVRMRADSRGEQTGRTLSASNAAIAISGGVELSVVPSDRWPAALRVAAHTGIVDGLDMQIVDGYTPFNDPIRLTRFEVGLSVWKPPAAPAGSRKTR